MDREFRNLSHRFEFLPLLACLYRNSFRSGNAESTSLSRLLHRVLYYPISCMAHWPLKGQLTMQVGNVQRKISIDVRNRQFSALYFDKYVNCYEPDVTALITLFLPPDGIFFDIGSNWGYFSLLVASATSFRGQVHAFEPMPATYRDLLSVIDQAGLCQSVTCHEMALGATDKDVSMSRPRHSGLARVRADGGGKLIVRQRRLDDLGLGSPDFIKLDAEGAEESILRGASRVLGESRPMIVFESACESGAESALSTMRLLEEYGYQLFIPMIEIRDEVSGESRLAFASRCSEANLRQATLKLLPVHSRSRHLFDPYLNLFACARERLGLVANRIDESWGHLSAFTPADEMHAQFQAA